MKHIPLSDLNPSTERVGWGRGSELFACTVFNLSIYFCLALCFFVQSRSHKLFKTPNILKIRFENTVLHRFSETKNSKNFGKLKISKMFRKIFAKNQNCCFCFFPENQTFKKNIFDFSRNFFGKFSKFSVFQKFWKKKFFRKSM